MTDPISCMVCSALVRRADIDAHTASHRGEVEAMRRVAQEVLADAAPDLIEAVVLRLMKGGSN